MKLEPRTKYYVVSIPLGILLWVIFSSMGISFINLIFFMMAYIWHFSLLAPGVKEMARGSRNKLSMLVLVYKLNFYLQMFIKIDRIKFGPAVVRAISPLLFILLLYLVGGSGNLFFGMLGSFIFECIYLMALKSESNFIMKTSDPETPPAIPSEENFRE